MGGARGQGDRLGRKGRIAEEILFLNRDEAEVGRVGGLAATGAVLKTSLATEAPFTTTVV